MTVPIRLKRKYTRTDQVKQQKSRTRTGPRCCNGGCGRRISKQSMAVLGKGKK